MISLIAMSLAMPALAQNTTSTTQPPQPADEEQERDVVVITANKREETVQDVAVAVTAITDELRDEIGLVTVQDYTNFAPGLSYSTANDRLGMRGVTRTSNNFGIRSGISNYVDGVYFSSAIPASREPIFVERVEVVRGPQGTLYGRDSIGGALNVITKRPTETFEGQVNVGLGNYDSRKVEFTAAGPINDWLRYRVGATRSYQDGGYLTNVATGVEEVGPKTDTYFEAQLEGDIGDRFEWWARYGSLSWNRVGPPGGRTAAGGSEPYDTRLFGAPGGANINSFYGFSPFAMNRVMAGTQTTNPNAGQSEQLNFNADFTQFTDLYPTTEGALELVYHMDDFDIKYLGGYVWYHYNLQIDNDLGPVSQFSLPFALFPSIPAGTPLSVARVTDYNENRAWYSNEVNFISTGDGPLQWIAGLYQYQENYSQPIYVNSMPPATGPLAGVLYYPTFTPAPDLPDFTGRNERSGSPIGGDLWYFSNNKSINNAYGAFLRTDWQINDEWKLSAGIRWSNDIMDGADQVRYISHYALGVPRADGTSAFFGGPDPTTVSTANPCGFAGAGVANTNVTTANSQAAQCPGGRSADLTRYGIYVDPSTGIASRQLVGEWEEVTGTVGLEWTPDSDTLIYAKYDRGYKPGGLGCSDTNCNLTVTPFTDKELVNAYEFGVKREWSEYNLTTNLDVFFYDYQGYQVSNTIVPEPDSTGFRPPAYVAYVNLPEVNTFGVELETIWYPTDNLRFLFNYGYTNPEIGDSPSLIHSLDPFARDPDAQPMGTPLANGQRGQNLNGNILPFSPKNKVALNGTYTWDFEDGSNVVASASYFWQDISYTNIFNRYLTKTPSWDQTDGRISWTSADGMFTLIGYVRNVFDELQYDGRIGGRRIGNINRDPQSVNQPFEQCGASARSTVLHTGTTPSGAAASPLGTLQNDCYTITDFYRPPRTYGVELQIRF
jgi:iron complex outermembrane receptor protein